MDAAKHEGPLHYLPVLHESYYSIHPPVACRVGKQMIPVPAKHWGLTVIDSGTNHVLLPSRVLDALKPALGREAPEPLSRVFDELCVAVPQETTPQQAARHFPSLRLAMRDLSGKPFVRPSLPLSYLQYWLSCPALSLTARDGFDGAITAHRC